MHNYINIFLEHDDMIEDLVLLYKRIGRLKKKKRIDTFHCYAISPMNNDTTIMASNLDESGMKHYTQ